MTEIKSILIDQFVRASMLLKRFRQMNMRRSSPIADPNRGQGRVLALLSLQPEISQKDLAYLLGIRNQSLSELLSKMEKAGYVTKEPSEADKRVMNVRLTDEGREAASQSQEQQKDFSDIFDCLDEEEQQNLSDYLSRLILELENEVGEDAFPFAEGCDDDRGDQFRAMVERFRGYGGYGFEGFGEGGFPPFPPHGGMHPDGFGGKGCRSDRRDRMRQHREGMRGKRQEGAKPGGKAKKTDKAGGKADTGDAPE